MNPPSDRMRTERSVGAASDGLLTARPVVEQRDHLGCYGTFNRPHDKRPQRRRWRRAAWIRHQNPVGKIPTRNMRTRKNTIQLQQ